MSPPPDIPPGRYRHFKGGEYEVVGLARHSETGEWLVVYRPLTLRAGDEALPAAARLWCRPAALWAEPAGGGARFTRVGGEPGP